MMGMDIPEEAVEAAAAGMWHQRPMQRTADGAPLPFSEAKSYQRVRYLDQAGAALQAAAPHMLAEAWEEGEVAGQDNRDSNRGYNIEHKYNPYRSQP